LSGDGCGSYFWLWKGELSNFEIYKEDEIIQKGIVSHHENFDGTGYPYGLKKENIPIIGRIIAIADSIDAMTTIRTYRKPVSMDQAIEEIQKGSGNKYDPYIVKSLSQLPHPIEGGACD